MTRKGKKRALRLLAGSIAGLLVVTVVAVGVLRWRLCGPGLANTIEDILNSGMRGRVEIESVEWPLRSLPTAITGGWIPIRIHGLRVYDDGGLQGKKVPMAQRELLLSTDLATGYIDAHSLFLGHHDFVIKDLTIPDGGYVLLRQVAERHPMNDYDTTAVSLISAFYPPIELDFHAGLSASSAAIFDIRNFHFRNVTLELVFPGVHVRAENVTTDGFFYSNFSDPLKGTMYYSLAPTAERGVLRLGGASGDAAASKDEAAPVQEIPLEDIRIERLAQLPLGWPRDTIAHDLRWILAARTPAGTHMRVQGGLLDYWVGTYGGDYDIRLDIDNGGSLLEALSGSLAGGDDVSLSLRLSGPSIGPRFDIELRGLDVRMPGSESAPPLDLEIARARAGFDLATGQGSLEDTALLGAGGEVRLSAAFGLAPLQFDIHADVTRPVHLGPYLPPEVRKLAGDHLRGRLRLVGDAERQQLDTLDLWLGRAHVTGELVADRGRTLHASRLKVRLGQSEVTSSGTVDLLSGRFDLGVSVDSRDLPVWLRSFDAPPVAGGLRGTARVTGTPDDPRARAKLTLTGVEALRQVDVDLGYGGGVVSVNQATSRGLDGPLWARGRVRLGKRPQVLGLEARGEGLDLGRVPQLAGQVTGRVDMVASARGPIDKLSADVATNIDGLTIAGDTYRFAVNQARCAPDSKRPAPTWTGIHLCTHADGSKELAFSVERGGGGTLGVNATLTPDGQLGGTVAMNALPLQQLGVLGGVRQSPVGGEVSTLLTLSGTTDAPTIHGTVDWFHAWFQRTFLGPGTFDVKPLGPGLIGLEGTLLQGDVRVSARIRTEAPYDSEIHVDLRRVELDRFAPELAKVYKTRGWLTGTIDATLPLVPTPGRAPNVTARLGEVELWLDNEDSHGRPAPVRVANAASTPLALHYDGTSVRLTEPVTLIGPGGAAFSLSGSANPETLDLRLAGNIAVSMAQPYVRDYFDAVSGTLAMQLAVRGPVATPDIVLDLEILEPVSVRPVGQEAVISLSKGGLVKITNDQITPTGLFVNVEDPYTGERAALKIGGGIRLEEFVPKSLGLIIEGELSGKLFLVLAPEVFSRASGVARVEMAVRGDPLSPKPYGEITFEPEQPLSLTPRGLRREIRLSGGEISFIGDDVELIDLVGSIDDEGFIRNIKGAVTFENLQPVSLDLSLSADSLPFRIPNTLDLTVNINEMSIVGNVEQGLDIGGDIEIVDGRYVRNFNLITDALTPESSGDSSKPFYEGVPLIADARLGLTIDTRGFFVQNNLATIQLIGEIGVSGTPRDPRLDGEIRVEQGTFKLPGLRSRFTRTRGSVSFSGYKKFPRDTPTLDVQSESDYRDPGGQEHLVTLTIKGPLSTLNWDLYTSSGLNKGQTVTMLLSGRTPEELRKTLGDEAPGSDPTRVDPSTSPTENVADQLLRDLAGDFISLLIEDKLRNLTTLDVARLEIGTGSIGFHGEKEVFKNLKFLSDLEQTLRGRTVDVRGQYRLSEKLSLESEYLSKDFEDDSEEDISDLRLRAVLRYFWP